MTSSKKYHYQLTEKNDTWTATVTRKVSRKKSITTKEQDGFGDEASAKQWAEETVNELATLQSSNNKVSAVKRKDNEELKRQRSARRAEKTEKAKLAAAEQKIEPLPAE